MDPAVVNANGVGASITNINTNKGVNAIIAITKANTNPNNAINEGNASIDVIIHGGGKASFAACAAHLVIYYSSLK